MKALVYFFAILIIPVTFPLRYVKSIETLNAVREIIVNKQKGALLRFGDGDLVLVNGRNSGTHAYSLGLKKELLEAFQINGFDVLKTLPILSYQLAGPEVEFFYGSHRINNAEFNKYIKMAKNVWPDPIDIVYSPVALAYTSVKQPRICLNFLKFLRNQNCALFIGNQIIPHWIISLFFKRNCNIVKTPSRSAYQDIDRIEQECLEKLSSENNDYKIIIVSCGNTGRVLIKRLLPQLENVFFFDFGSLMDAICNKKSRGWIKRSNFNYKEFIFQFTKSIHE